jgi:TonB-linked SusC/RagA family outer membrane protein
VARDTEETGLRIGTREGAGEDTGVPSPVFAAVLLGVVLAAAAAPLHAQEPSVAGVVLDARSQEPLSGVLVVAVGSELRAVTDSRGRFRIHGETGPEVRLRASRLGYQPLETASRPGDLDLRLMLHQAVLELAEVVVTGTVGGAERRAIGNAVTRIDAARVAEVAPVPSVAALINARAPGVVVQSGSGMVGAGSRIRIRGTASFFLSDQPLIYLDGIRLNNRIASGPGIQTFGDGAVSRLDDLNPDDIERIEIIKGPAAATLYGTEASNGVIQVFTKRGTAGERPEFSLTVRQGASWFANPEGRIPESYSRDPETDEVLIQNIVRQERLRGTPIFRTGHLREAHLAMAGGSDGVRYHLSGSYEDAGGVEPTNRQRRFRALTTLSLSPTNNLDVDASLGLVRGRTNFSFEFGGVWANTYFHTPALRETPTRGFAFAPPEVLWQVQAPRQDLSRVTTGVQVSHRPSPWFRHRLSIGLDLTEEHDESVIERMTDPEVAQFFPPAFRDGSKTLRRTAVTYQTLDYSATLTFQVAPEVVSATSAGTQYYRNLTHTVSAEGVGFPAPGLRILDAVADPSAGENEIENVTLGLFVQQQFAWRNRAFVTAGVRGDDNSAFGENLTLVYYPKVSGSWVVSEEPFWTLSALDPVRLRMAYGHTGQQPVAFAALQTWQPVTGGGGQPVLTPLFSGNPDLKPERGVEWELGLDAGTENARLGVELTWYQQTTRDAMWIVDVAPSLGFPGRMVKNVGTIRNRGYELSLRGVPVRTGTLTWDLTANLSRNDNTVLDLGGDEAIVFGMIQHRVGYPVAGYFLPRVVSAELDSDGRAINVMCDSGPDSEEAAVSCAGAPAAFLGRPSPRYEGALISEVTFLERWRIHAMADFKAGHHQVDNLSRWRCASQTCRENFFPEEFDPTVIAEIQTNLRSYTVRDASWVRLQEVAVQYRMPEPWAERIGARGATITLAGRNLRTWTRWPGVDPEGFDLSLLQPGWSQNETPQLRQFVTTINVRF